MLIFAENADRDLGRKKLYCMQIKILFSANNDCYSPQIYFNIFFQTAHPLNCLYFLIRVHWSKGWINCTSHAHSLPNHCVKYAISPDNLGRKNQFFTTFELIAVKTTLPGHLLRILEHKSIYHNYITKKSDLNTGLDPPNWGQRSVTLHITL